MKVVGRERLKEFSRRHGDARSQINAWLLEAEEARWETPQDIRTRYPHASFLQERRVIFNLKGNHYRLEVKVSYHTGTVVIVRIGTHAQYDKWDS
jgi:mRNA interferase HigB